MGIKLTKKQKRLVDFLGDFIDENGYCPSYREIASGLGLKSVASVAEHIDHLVTLGVLKRSDNSARSLELVDLSFPETTALFNTRFAVATDPEKEILEKAAKILGIDLEEKDDK